ncbi:hypothetical protein CEXT_356301 [Caerostris extrusa]|uniref:Uncharacterized protein n=1 Tax=Caerostris extrusa TaxID=172846 RepID=A0AAV4Q776_CAEEX|nr:hypothetical protein CEXT_356301 [Caerostris extrusa]
MCVYNLHPPLIPRARVVPSVHYWDTLCECWAVRYYHRTSQKPIRILNGQKMRLLCGDTSIPPRLCMYDFMQAGFTPGVIIAPCRKLASQNLKWI